MIVSRAAIQTLNGDSSLRFERKLIEYLRIKLPSETRPRSDAEIAETIRQCSIRGERIGITSEAGVARLVCLTYLDPEFDSTPEFRRLFDEPGLHPETKLRAFVELLNEQIAKGLSL